MNDATPKFECSCVNCQSACRKKPGWFLPGQIEDLASNLNITVAELFRDRLAVDWWVGDDDLPETFVLSPAIKEENAGTEFPGDPNGSCTFHRADGSCEIHALGKPHECAALTHTDRASHRETARAWVEHQDQIRELLDREPHSKPYKGGSLFNLLSMFDE
jgi:hypothetical protein